jgi:two-component system CheB/CheR fusion protein
MTTPSPHVVAIGASSGGLKALQELLSHLKPGLNAAFVVAQHLAPDHASQIVPLLSRITRLRVESATAGQALEPDLLLVIPPNVDATVENGCLQLKPPEPRFSPSPSIDRLLESIASACADRGVAIILSGTGSDGACGLRSIGANGGLTFVQSPDSALFDAMPAAAIALGHPDWIAPPQLIAARLTECLADGGPTSPEPTEDQHHLLSLAIQRLKDVTGIDFSQYKESTLLRQFHRRMVVSGMSTLEAYLKVLRADSDEPYALMQNLLVTVTSFFRNPDAFDELKRQLTPLLKDAPLSSPFRVWVPGCATGEEAYTIAMIIGDILGHQHQLSNVLRIFATDLDESSLTIARKATYPIVAADSIPPGLRQRFTQVKGNQFEITKELRACVIFARHNLCEDPPFPDIRLVSCRNLLIYFTSALQEKVISILSFSLLPGGVLFLGDSESLGPMPGFQLVNPAYRIYAREQTVDSRNRLASFLGQRRASKARLPSAAISERDSLPTQHLQLLDALIRVFAKPSLVLDENHLLIEVIGDVSPFCQMPQGRLTNTAINFLRDELKTEARALFLLARAGRGTVRSARLHLSDWPNPLRLEASIIEVDDQALMLLSFVEDAEPEAPTVRFDSSERNTILAHEIERLEKELLDSQETLRRSLLHLEQTNEELEASSEELQASLEELQSSNEELEASNEELQATNDETGLLNQQLRVRSDELEKLNTDLENIQRSLNQGMVIVDQDLRVTLFSPLAVRVFGLVAADIGHPLIGIPTTVPIQGLREALLSVLNEGCSCNLQALSEENSYWLQLMPYRNSESQILGVIMTMTDISELVALRRVAEASLLEFESLTDAIDQAVWKRDLLSQKILYVSSRIEQLTGWKASEVTALPDLLDSAIVLADRAAVFAAREAGPAGWDVTYEITRRDGSLRTLREVAIPLEDASSDHAVVGTLTDITEHQQQASEFACLRESLQSLIQDDPQPMALLDGDLRVVVINEALSRTLRASSGELAEASLETLDRRLVPLGSASGEPPMSLVESLRAMVQQAKTRSIASARLAVSLAVEETLSGEGIPKGLPSEGSPPERSLEVIPIPYEPGAPGVLLRLTVLAPGQGQSSSIAPDAD